MPNTPDELSDPDSYSDYSSGDDDEAAAAPAPTKVAEALLAKGTWEDTKQAVKKAISEVEWPGERSDLVGMALVRAITTKHVSRALLEGLIREGVDGVRMDQRWLVGALKAALRSKHYRNADKLIVFGGMLHIAIDECHYRPRWPALLRVVAPHFRTTPGAVLLEMVRLSAAARASGTASGTFDSGLQDELEQLATDLQLASAGLLASLPRFARRPVEGDRRRLRRCPCWRVRGRACGGAKGGSGTTAPPHAPGIQGGATCVRGGAGDATQPAGASVCAACNVAGRLWSDPLADERWARAGGGGRVAGCDFGDDVRAPASQSPHPPVAGSLPAARGVARHDDAASCAAARGCGERPVRQVPSERRRSSAVRLYAATLPASTHHSTQTWLLFLLVWALTLAINEALEMRRHGFAFWAADRLNLLSLPPFVCAPVGLAALLLAETARDATAGSLLSDGGRSTSAIVGQDLVAISAALLMLSELLRLFQLSDSLAPLVTALFHMLGDVLQWLLLSSVFLAALAVGLYSRLSGLGAPSAGPLPPPPPRTEFPPAAEDQTGAALRMLKSFKPPETHLSPSSDTCDVAAMAMGESVWATLSLLVSGLFGGETYVDCIDPQRDRVTAFLLSTYVVVGTVLLVNVLIAMLTKSFDSVGARSRQLAHLTFARTVIQCERQPVAPPPLSALSLPYVLLSAAARRLRGGRRRRGYAPLHAPEAELDLDITKLRSAKAGQSGSAWEDTDADDSRLVAVVAASPTAR